MYPQDFRLKNILWMQETLFSSAIKLMIHKHTKLKI